MKRSLLFSLVFILGILLNTIITYAVSYTDNMDNAISNDIRSFVNLNSVNTNSTWGNDLPDKTLLSFSNMSYREGRAIYTVRSAESMTVGIYTQTGAFASWIDSDKVYALGFPNLFSDHTSRPQGSERVFYSPSTQMLYRNSGKLQSLAFNNYFEFRDSNENVPSDLIDYGVNVYESKDGQNYSKVRLSPGKILYISASSYCYEEFTASLSSGTVSVIVEINDFIQFWDVSRNRLSSKTQFNYMTSLALVSFDGRGLEVGPQAVNIPEIPVSSSSSGSSPVSQNQSSSKASGSSRAASASSSKASGNSRAASGSSSKFEGVITSSSASSSQNNTQTSRSSSKQAQSSGSSRSGQSSSEESLSTRIIHGSAGNESAEQEYDDTQAFSSAEVISYEVKNESGSMDGFTVGIIIYIGAVCLFILFMILRSTRK